MIILYLRLQRSHPRPSSGETAVYGPLITQIVIVDCTIIGLSTFLHNNLNNVKKTNDTVPDCNLV